MYQIVCDRCGDVIPMATDKWMVHEKQSGSAEIDFVGNGKMRQAHLCRDCTERLVDWLTEGVRNDEPKD